MVPFGAVGGRRDASSGRARRAKRRMGPVAAERELARLVEDLARIPDRSGFVAERLDEKYRMLLDDRGRREKWLAGLELDAKARRTANEILDALRDVVPWALRAIEAHLAGSVDGRRLLAETAKKISAAVAENPFELPDRPGQHALDDMDYHLRGRLEAEGYLRFHTALTLCARPDEAWLLRITDEVRKADTIDEPWPESLQRLAGVLNALVPHRRSLTGDQVKELLDLARRPDDEWDDLITASQDRRARRISRTELPEEARRLVAARGRLPHKRKLATRLREQLAEAMDLAAELRRVKRLHLRQAWRIAARRLPLVRPNAELVPEAVRLQLIMSSPQILWAELAEPGC